MKYYNEYSPFYAVGKLLCQTGKRYGEAPEVITYKEYESHERAKAIANLWNIRANQD